MERFYKTDTLENLLMNTTTVNCKNTSLARAIRLLTLNFEEKKEQNLLTPFYLKTQTHCCSVWVFKLDLTNLEQAHVIPQCMTRNVSEFEKKNFIFNF